MSCPKLKSAAASAHWARATKPPPAVVPAEVEKLAQKRELARAERDFAAADRLRDEIAALGWEVRDGQAGFELLPL